jgi:Grx4 family monothiol glutaredoxin
MDVMERIDSAVKENPVVIFMKGTPQIPQCGYSSRTAQALAACGQEFAHVNVLADPEIFQNLPRYANWPTFPWADAISPWSCIKRVNCRRWSSKQQRRNNFIFGVGADLDRDCCSSWKSQSRSRSALTGNPDGYQFASSFNNSSRTCSISF